MKNPNSNCSICEIIETRMNQIILKINETDSIIIEADPLHSKLRILDPILYKV